MPMLYVDQTLPNYTSLANTQDACHSIIIKLTVSSIIIGGGGILKSGNFFTTKLSTIKLLQQNLEILSNVKVMKLSTLKTSGISLDDLKNLT